MRAFGIDPGSRYTGWGVVEKSGSTYRMVDCGVIAVGDKRPLSDRLQDIFRSLGNLLEEHTPDAVFLESIFHHKSARAALVLGHARGVAMLAAGMRELEVHEISPSEVKKAVTGRGRAEKTQVQAMIQVLLGLPQVPQEDASDALAIAFAGLTRVHFASALVQGTKARRGYSPPPPGWMRK